MSDKIQNMLIHGIISYVHSIQVRLEYQWIPGTGADLCFCQWVDWSLNTTSDDRHKVTLFALVIGAVINVIWPCSASNYNRKSWHCTTTHCGSLPPA